MKNFFSRFLSQIKSKPLEDEVNASLTFGIAAFQIKKPVLLSKEKPGPDDMDAKGRCLYGLWSEEEDSWEFGLQHCPHIGDTHWLPVSSEVTPHKIFRP
jgi:hypothetical protein